MRIFLYTIENYCFRFALLSCIFIGISQMIFSEEKNQTLDMISKVEKIKENLNSIEKFGFEVELEPKDSGRKVKVFGVIDNIKPSESWFVAVDAYLLNMPIEGFIDGEYFICNINEGGISKIKDCSFRMTFKPIENKIIEKCLSIKSNEFNNFFQLISPEISESEIISIVNTKSLSTLEVKKKDINLSYTFSEGKLISNISYYDSLETRFRSYFYYDLEKLKAINELIRSFLLFAKEDKIIKLGKLEKTTELRIILIRILSMRTNYFKSELIESWAIKTFNKPTSVLKENYSKVRIQFTDYIFSEISLVQKWSDLFQGDK